MIQAHIPINFIVVTKVHIKLGIVCWEETDWTAESLEGIKLVQGWKDLLVRAELDEV